MSKSEDYHLIVRKLICIFTFPSFPPSNNYFITPVYAYSGVFWNSNNQFLFHKLDTTGPGFGDEHFKKFKTRRDIISIFKSILWIFSSLSKFIRGVHQARLCAKKKFPKGFQVFDQFAKKMPNSAVYISAAEQRQKCNHIYKRCCSRNCTFSLQMKWIKIRK